VPVTRAEILSVRELRNRRSRVANGLFVAEGVKVVSELVASPMDVEAVFSTDPSFLNGLKGDFTKEQVNATELGRMSSLSTPNTVLAVARIPAVQDFSLHDAQLVVALDGLRDPGNLGTIIRTAAWFGADRVVCSTDCVDVWSPKVVQGAMGALFHRPPLYVDDLPSFLRSAEEAGLSTLAATLEGNPLSGEGVPGRSVLVIGSESHGVSAAVREVCGREVGIPRFGDAHTVESLNAAIAAGVLLSALRSAVRAG
jgi:TrmH family RNA methyltransferase